MRGARNPSPLKRKRGRMRKVDGEQPQRKTRRREAETMKRAAVSGGYGGAEFPDAQGGSEPDVFDGDGDELGTSGGLENLVSEPVVPDSLNAIDEDQLELYIAQFQAGNVGFVPIGTYLFAVQGWNRSKEEPSVC